MNRNRKMLIVLVALCLIIGVGVAGTLMMAGGSEAVGCEAQFDGSSELLLYSGVDSEDSIYADIRDLPSPLTVTEETEGADIKWYCLEGENWPESLADYHYVKSTGWTLIEKDETPIEAVELTGDIVINSEDTQLSANVVDDKTVAEIENGLSIPQADANVSRETYCFDIHAEEEASTTVTVSGIAKPGSTVSVYHMYDDTDYTKFEILPCTVGADGSVTFTTESFSEFYFTVDFHNGEKTYSIAGMSSVLLSEVFAQLEIDEDATQAESVVFSDETLLSVERQEDGDWLLTSLQAFTTEETLTITFADGHQLVMNVTDAGIQQQTTNDDVLVSEKVWGNNKGTYQVLGTLYTEEQDILMTYYTYGGGHYRLNVTMKVKDENGNTITSVSGNCRNVIGLATDPIGLRFSSGKYWFYVDSYSDCSFKYRPNTDNCIDLISLNVFNKGKMSLIAYPLASYSKAETGYCSIKQVSKTSFDKAYRDIELYVFNDDTQQYDLKWKDTGILFPDRGMNSSDISVGDVNEAQYDVQISTSGNTYIVKLSPKTSNVTATAMPAGLGDKNGVGITGVQLTGGFYHNDVSGSETASARFLLNTQYTMTASVKSGYVFAGWYDGDSSSANLVSTDQTYTATLTSQNDVTLYARAVEINPLYVDSYYRAGNGRYGCAWGIDDDPSSFRINFTGAEVTKNYMNSRWWYIVNGHDLISDGTVQRDVTITGTLGTETDTNAMAVGTDNPNDNFYNKVGRFYYGTYYLDGDAIDFWKAGVGLDIASLGYVRYQADDQVWKYAYQWTYSTWKYDFINRNWVETKHPVSFPLSFKEGIPVPIDKGRINFLYKQDPEPGTNSFYLRYYGNGIGVENVPEMQVEKNLAYDSYWFTVAGLATEEMQPKREGHTFVGWSTDRHHDPSDTGSADIWTPEKFNRPITSDEDFKNRQIEVKANTILNPERLYAIWEKKDTSITVTYHWNDGRDGDDTYETQTYDKARALTALDKPDAPTREGYTFAGWYYDEDCNDGSEVKWNGLEKLYADTEIYARWVVNITGKSMQASLGDKKGSQLYGGGIKEIQITDKNFNDIKGSWVTDKKITGVYDAYEEFELKAIVNDGYRFIGWYDSNEVDENGQPTGKLISTKPVLKGKADKNTTYYARAVEESLLAVDYYVRLSNGRFVYSSDWQTNRKIYGVEVTKDYSNNKNWYLIANYGLISDGTKAGTVNRVFKDDTNAMLIGTGNANDTFYSGYNGFKTSYFQGKDKGHYDFRYYDYTDSSGKLWNVPFKMAGVGLDIVTLNNVYYDADMRSSGSKLSGQTWKYGYQWTTSYWTYTIKNGWQEHSIKWELEDIPVYEDEGRINFVYEMETRPGNNSFYLKYHSNLAGDQIVRNIPATQSKTKIDEQSYWFSIAGLYPKGTQPTCVAGDGLYTFVGWSTDPNHDPDDTTGSDIYTYEKYKQSVDNGDFDWRQIEVKLAEGSNTGTVHLYAIWKKTPAPDHFTVTFDLNYLNSDSVDNEDDPGNIDTSNVWEVVNVKKGEIASDPGTPTRDGYTFAGWYFTRENDPGTEYDRANTPVNSNLVVYAKWNPDYVVHYYIEGTTTKVAPDKVVPNNAVGSVVSETAPDFAGCKFVGNSRDESITIKYNYKDNEIIFYYTKDADYTIKYYKGSVSDANDLGQCTVTGTVDEVITVPAGSDIGQLDYKKPVGYRSGVLQDTNVKVKADNSSVVRVVYPADTVEYTVEAYIMGTDGQYPASPTKTEKKPDLTNKEVSAPTDTAYWVDDAEKDAFTFDSANENNVISGTVAGDNSTVLKVYISRNQYTLTWDVTKDDDTTYKVGDTTKYYYGQAVTEPKVEVPDYYDFDNWEKGGVDWPDTMPKNDVNISGELIRQRTDLVISKSGMEQGESAIFTVTGKGLGSGMKVIVPSGESVKIKNLPVGESYTITEQNDWSWKYEAHSSVTRTLTAENTETVHFSNVPKLIKWLTDEFYVDNKFGIWR